MVLGGSSLDEPWWARICGQGQSKYDFSLLSVALIRLLRKKMKTDRFLKKEDLINNTFLGSVINWIKHRTYLSSAISSVPLASL